MNVFLDDLRDPPPGEEWIVCRTAQEAMDLVRAGRVTFISFDHDLGTELTGYDVANLIEQSVMTGAMTMPRWRIHSANPVGRKNIEAAMSNAARFAAC